MQNYWWSLDFRESRFLGVYFTYIFIKYLPIYLGVYFIATKIFTDVMGGMSSADTAFKLFDKDRDGYITRAEFAKVV